MVPQKATIHGQYYRNNIMSQENLESLIRMTQDDSVFKRALVRVPSRALFVNGRRADSQLQKTQNWCRKSLPILWTSVVGSKLTPTSISSKTFRPFSNRMPK